MGFTGCLGYGFRESKILSKDMANKTKCKEEREKKFKEIQALDY
jgi:hypothetical protein